MKYDLPQCFGSRLRRLSRIADGYYRKRLVDFNITENQMTMLFALSKLGKIEQGKIGELLVLERSTVSRNMKILQKQGLVQRTADYRPEVALTEAGEALVQTLIPLWQQVMEELAEQFGLTGTEAIKVLEAKLL